MYRRSLSVLCDLRPAFDGFYGISHETRLMFSLLHELDDVQVTGPIHQSARVLARALGRNEAVERASKPAGTIEVLSRFGASRLRAPGAGAPSCPTGLRVRSIFSGFSC